MKNPHLFMMSAPSTRLAVPGIRQALGGLAPFILLLLLGDVSGLGVAAQDEIPTGAPMRQGMPVKIANRTIIVLRGPIAGYTATERVTGAMNRIEKVLDAEASPAVTTEETEDGTRVLLGGEHAFMVTKIDIDPQAGETTKNVAREAARRLQQAIADLREQESPRFLATAAFYCALATLLYGGLLWGLIRLKVWIGKRLSVAAGVRSQKIHISGIKLLDMGQVMLIPRRLSTLIAWVIGIALTDGWLGYVLSQFPYTRPWGERVGANLLDIVEQVGSAIVGAMPGLVFAIVIFVVARQIIRLAAVFFDRVETGKLDIGWIDADTVKPTRRICNFVIWVFALAMAYPYLPGAQTEAFKGLSLMLGLMVSLGSSSMIAQAFSGLILIYNRAFRRGDYVSIGASEGTVLELGMFMTRIQTGLGEEITLPNSSILAATIKNYSRAVPGAGNIVDTVVTIGYSVPWRQVQAMLEEAARRTQFLSRTPEPLVRQTALSDFYVEYRLIAHTAAGAAVIRAEVLNVLHGHIQDVFNEHGVQIMSPHYMMDTKEPQVVPRDQWYAAPAKPPEEPEGKS